MKTFMKNQLFRKRIVGKGLNTTTRMNFRIDLIQRFSRLVNGLVYYGVSLAAKDFTGNFHRDFILSSLVEFPAAVIAVIASM